MITTSIVQQKNPLDWYALTESLNSILNGLIAYTMRERRSELKKTNPNQQRILELQILRDEVSAINDDPGSFEDLGQMGSLIDHYSPMLLAVKKKAQLKN